MAWTCFLIEPTDLYHHFRRRYAGSHDSLRCTTATGYHSATLMLKVVRRERTPVTNADDCVDEYLREDGRWPVACGCGYLFTTEDHWQDGYHAIFERRDTGEQHTLLDAPVGAMWRASWMADVARWNPTLDPRGPLVVRLPGGHDWNVDGESASGGRWTRSGEPPRVTVTPSISVPGYHGFLRDGVLSNDVDGR